MRVEFKFNETTDDLYAFFPETKQAYSYGFFVECSLSYVKESRNALPSEYLNLKNELINKGYSI